MIPKTQTGTIKFFRQQLGYGFITPDGCDPSDKTQDRFFHFSQLNVEKAKNSRYKSIPNGTRVSFTPTHGEHGLAAMNVTPI